MLSRGPVAIVAAYLLIKSPATWAQPCQPFWNPTVGSPGIGSGYVGPMIGWDDGSGARPFAGGSYTSIGGTTARYLAAWDPASNAWSALGRGIAAENTTFIAAMIPFDPGGGEQLVVGGAFGSAGGVAGTKSLGMWDGQRWSALGSQLLRNSADSVWSLAVWNATLYAGGKFADIGGVTANSIAAWDGVGWSALGSGVFGGFSPFVTSLIVFDDGSGEALYAGGRFDGIGGVSTRNLARWDGTSWSRVGGGLSPTSSLFGVEAMTVFDDGTGPALYVAAHSFFPAGQPATNVAKWDGQSWTSVGQEIGTGRLTSIAVFDDGTGPALHVGGTAMPGINYIARLDNGVWVTLDGGVGGAAVPPSNWPSVFGLAVWDNALFVGGNFTEAGAGRQAAGIVARISCLRSCYPDCNPNGVLDIFDFLCFQNSFVAGEPYACDCDPDPACNIFDFLCFQNAFVAGCP